MSISRGLFFLIACLPFVTCSHNLYVQGERTYIAKCANCHMEDGSGLNALIPDLRQSLNALTVSEQACTIIYGIKSDSIGEIMKAMPHNKSMSTTDLTNLLNYINHKWSDVNEITMIQVKEASEMCNKKADP